MSARKIVVIGDMIIDKLTKVKVRGVSPEHDSALVLNIQETSQNLGGAGNVANCAAELAEHVVLYAYENSSSGVPELMLKSRIDHRFYKGTAATPVKHRIMTAAGNYLFRLDTEDGLNGDWDGVDSSIGVGRLVKDAVQYLESEAAYSLQERQRHPILCLVDYGKGLFSDATAHRIMQHCDRMHEAVTFPIIVDPGRSGDWHRFSSPRTIFKANLLQAEAYVTYNQQDDNLLSIIGDCDISKAQEPDEYVSMMHRMLSNLMYFEKKFAYVVLTLGPGGIIAGRVSPETEEFETVYVPGIASRTIDTCGAGDVVTATLAAYFSEVSTDDKHNQNLLSWEIAQHAIVYANQAAAVSTTKLGVVTVSREEIQWPSSKPMV